MKKYILLIIFTILTIALSGCRPTATAFTGPVHVLAAESFLQDIAQNVAGDRLQVEYLVPAGIDPHTFELTPADAAKLEDANMLIINGGGLEEWLESSMDSLSADLLVVEASAGLESRETGGGEPDGDHRESDPHFWLNPLLVRTYVENIRDALIRQDPDGRNVYTRNAEEYIRQLEELDAWIQAEINPIPPADRLLISNHESFGYYADQYGLTIIGTLLTSASTSASPSARELADLVDQIHATGAKAILLETGANPQLAAQIAEETGIRVVSNIYTHSLTTSDGPAPSYLEMMRYNTSAIVAALQGN